MCRLRNIALGVCQTDGQTDRRTDGRTDGRTDRQTDDGQSDPFVSLCFAGDTKIGTAIGSKLGMTYACTYMGEWETELFSRSEYLPSSYYRYIDDV